MNKVSEKKVIVKDNIKKNSVFKALLNKEFKKFTSSANYMLNCGLGSLFILIFSVTILFQKDTLLSILAIFDINKDLYPILSLSLLCMLASMNDITAPSISLEGKNIWIYQSLPIQPITIFLAKMAIQCILTIPPIIIASISLMYVLHYSILDFILVTLISCLFILYLSLFGLITNLLYPNLNWTNEVAVIKQSLPVFMAIFINLLIVILSCIGSFMISQYLDIVMIYNIWLITILLANRLMYNWLLQKGRRIFINL